MIVADHFDKGVDNRLHLPLGLLVPFAERSLLGDHLLGKLHDRRFFRGRILCDLRRRRRRNDPVFDRSGRDVGYYWCRRLQVARRLLPQQLVDQRIVFAEVAGPPPIGRQKRRRLTAIINALGLQQIALALRRSALLQQRGEPLARRRAVGGPPQEIKSLPDFVDLLLR